MARITELDGALKPAARLNDCGDCLHFYKQGVIPAECRECRHFPLIRGNVKDNFIFTAVRRGRPGPKRA